MHAVVQAGQLQRFRPRAPTRSPLFQGSYQARSSLWHAAHLPRMLVCSGEFPHACCISSQVLYTSNPSAPGGPVLRSAPGQAVFAGQSLRQTIAAPDVFQNEVGFKTLGLFPGTALQEGRWRALDGTRYVVRACTFMTLVATLQIPQALPQHAICRTPPVASSLHAQPYVTLYLGIDHIAGAMEKPREWFP
jgi:hypothetical protein